MFVLGFTCAGVAAVWMPYCSCSPIGYARVRRELENLKVVTHPLVYFAIMIELFPPHTATGPVLAGEPMWEK